MSEPKTSWHPRNIVRGKAAVFFISFPVQGWILPGQRFTADYAEAERWAMQMDALMVRNAAFEGTGIYVGGEQ